MSATCNNLAQLGLATVAMEALLAVQLGLKKFDDIKRECRGSVYWPEFVTAVKAGQVNENWLPGIVGKVVMGWARQEAA
ncbi:MAG: hypothetical protein WCK57_07140 [Verrucomicrobiae bacterium]